MGRPRPNQSPGQPPARARSRAIGLRFSSRKYLQPRSRSPLFNSPSPTRYLARTLRGSARSAMSASAICRRWFPARNASSALRRCSSAAALRPAALDPTRTLPPAVAPLGAPGAAPFAVRVAAPLAAPFAVPVVAPLAVPVVSPLAVPVVAPLAVPVVSPLAVPVVAPLAVPVVAPLAVP